MKIRRTTIQYDALGRILSEHVEQLTEDENQNVEETHATSVLTCEACGRPVEKFQDIRGRCVECGRQCCITCEGAGCAICSRPLCGNDNCRRGFAEKGLSVCRNCLPELEVRLARQDHMIDEKVKFERLMSVYGALMKLTQQGSHSSESLSDVLAHIAQIRLSRKLSQLAQEITRDQDHDRRLLP